MKKLICTLLFALLLTLLFSACGGRAENKNDIIDGMFERTESGESDNKEPERGLERESEEKPEKESVVIDYGDAEAFEAALNDGENLEGKIVSFTVLEIRPQSALGCNIWAGEHLNFVSTENPDIKEGEMLTVKATEIENLLGSWVIRYEKADDAVIGETTIFLSLENEPDTETEKVDNDSTETQSVIFQGIEFGIPVYYDAQIGGGAETMLHYYPEQENFFCSLVFESEALDRTAKMTKEQFDSLKEALVEQQLETIVSEGYSVEYSNPATIAGLSGWTFLVSKPGVKRQETLGYSILYDADNGVLINVYVACEGNDESGYDYIGDYQRMIECAKRVSLPEKVSDQREGIRPEFKEAMDSYEAFYNEYCDLLLRYTKNPTDLSLLLKYSELVGKASEMDEAFSKWENEEDLSNEELAYLLEVYNRVMQRMLSVVE